ncbi:hypothetical protein [Sphingobacterium pedocola]|uniref:Uncharacterized protein n=1 Tax=Sphingobacterium pedocola TaxID=2082722 RepID=A0ABR9TBP0_9SPHI|nr:hypothetical protein [Sphingobacterium pedocola]MBE8722695.1 hypothetical protein [Sphingobacterium pedocola]
MAWFSLNPGGDPTQPNDYTLQSSEPTCSGQNQICAVQANPDGSNNPQLTAALKDEMIDALHNRTATDNVSLRNA